jgi:hypothetical protein
MKSSPSKSLRLTVATSVCFLGVIVFVFASMPFIVFGSMSSTNYTIQSDSLNFGGGSSASNNYSEQDTMGEISSGVSSSTNYTMNAGYQQMLGSYISLAASGATLPDIGGTSGGTSATSSTYTVLTDDSAGYALTIQAATSPALQDVAGDYFSDYAPSGGVPDYAFGVSSSQSVFGFALASVDAVSRYKNNGTVCNSGSNSSMYNCWDGLSTSPKTISEGSTGNQPNGATTTIQYEVGIGSAKIQTAGNYSATITVTATAL